MLAGVIGAYAQIQFAVHHARIVLEGGAPFTKDPQIIPDQTERLVPGCLIQSLSGGLIEYAIDPRSRAYDPNPQDGCAVRISVKGYQSVHVTLKENAVIVMKRIGEQEGLTVSSTALNAPKDARKAYEQGSAALADRKWDIAQKDFEKAVAIYPEYAPAWDDLGASLLAQSKLAEARAAWERSVKADPRYIKPYLPLARMAIVENRPQDASDLAEKALAQNPVEFPGIYFYYAIAQHSLGHQDVAEKFALRATELDATHEYPRAEFLLGTLLDARGDRKGAIEHLGKYLDEAPKAVDADQVRQRIATLEQSAATD
jgi:tetratricopeptide (TPR) repeat protein